jgi:hypothetical protein
MEDKPADGEKTVAFWIGNEEGILFSQPRMECSSFFTEISICLIRWKFLIDKKILIS